MWNTKTYFEYFLLLKCGTPKRILNILIVERKAFYCQAFPSWLPHDMKQRVGQSCHGILHIFIIFYF
jgi:hypothetical protein